MTRKTVRELQNYVAVRGRRITATARMAEKRRYLLRGADLRNTDLRGADLPYANLHRADLSDANLHRAGLRGADLSDANLSGANLRDANLRDANFDGCVMNWNSHELIAERLRQAAGDNVQRLILAGLVLIAKDWCWDMFLSLDVPERDWALREMASWICEGDNVPQILINALINAIDDC